MAFWRGPATALASLLAATSVLAADGSGTDNPALLGLEPEAIAETAPPEIFDPPLDLDWRLALRGAYELSSSGGAFTAIAAPEFTLTHQALNTDLAVSGASELVTSDTGESRISSLTLGADGRYQLGALSHLDGTLDLSLTQSKPDDPSLPANTAIAPVIFGGDAGASFTQGLGMFEGTLRGSLGRSIHGETTLDDSSTIDNSAENDWRVGAGARLGYKLTPLLTPFIDGGVEWQRFDAPSPSLLVYLDALTYTAKAGVSYRHDTTLSAEAAAGIAWRDYTDPSLTDAAGFTADASVTFRPSETLTLDASLDTALAPSELTPGDTVTSYVAAGSATYIVNPWITLRGSAGWSSEHTLGTGDVTTIASVGAGLDYKVTDHAALTADYAFSRTDAPPDPVEDTQAISVGVKFLR
ncbi:MAG TPA: outer membrane beta-barrel protein [Devosia sp.]|nr:outer membrane beta-barrel protein [Devosia sp.]